MSYNTWFGNYVLSGRLLIRGNIGPHEFLTGQMTVFSGSMNGPSARFGFSWNGVLPPSFSFSELLLPDEDEELRSFWQAEQDSWWEINDHWTGERQVIVAARTSYGSTDVPPAHPALLAYYFAIRSILADRFSPDEEGGKLNTARATAILSLTALIRDQFRPWRAITQMPLV